MKKLVIAIIKGKFHSLRKLHRYEYFRNEIRLFGIIPIWWSYVYIKCADCNKEFYKDE